MANPHDERDLEAELHRLYLEGGKLDPPYWARRFYQMFTPGCQKYVGGIGAVRKLLDAGGHASGLLLVVKYGREDLTIEKLVLSQEWRHLFRPYDYKKAEENLRLARALSK